MSDAPTNPVVVLAGGVGAARYLRGVVRATYVRGRCVYASAPPAPPAEAATAPHRITGLFREHPIGEALDAAGLAEVGGIRTNISGCTNSCGQHHISDIGFFGAERRANGRSAPGYQMLLGGYVGQEKIHFGDKALRLPAKNAPEAAVRVVRRFAEERTAGEDFRSWLDRSGGAKEVGSALKELDEFPAYENDPEFYVDYGETGPYVKEIGESECAT